MLPLSYTIIRNLTQYNQYCKLLENVLVDKRQTKAHKDTAELLTLLIEKWDEEHEFKKMADPIELLKYLMEEHQMKSVTLSKILHVSVSLVSDMLNYRRSLSKDVIRKLSAHFKVSQELFNRPYALMVLKDSSFKDKSLIKSKRALDKA
ncbi:MAG: transcriptional regulator [Flavitalea sp.]